MTTPTTPDRQDAQRELVAGKGLSPVKGPVITLKPLTDEQVRLLINDVPDYDIGIYELFEFARAIERAHGIGE